MQPISINTSKVKEINIELVKTALKALKSGTKLTVAHATGLSVATCGYILNELLACGEVIEADYEESRGGRPAKRFLYNADYAYIACIYVSFDMGSSKISYVVTNLLGDIIEEKSAILAIIDYKVIDDLVQQLIHTYENIKAVGVGIPGIVRTGTICTCDIKELAEIPLTTRLKAKYKLEVIVENDMNLTTYGFYKKMNYEDKSIAVVAFPQDNCPGAGIIINGHIIKGKTNFAGEISYLPFKISREAQLQKTKQLDTYFPFMADILISIIAVLNPETIVLTGGLIQLDLLDELITACLKKIPAEHIPQIIIEKNMHNDYMHGLIAITLESLAYNLQLIEKRM